MSRGTIRLAYILLGLLTVASFGGPFVIGIVSPRWRPSRTGPPTERSNGLPWSAWIAGDGRL